MQGTRRTGASVGNVVFQKGWLIYQPSEIVVCAPRAGGYHSGPVSLFGRLCLGCTSDSFGRCRHPWLSFSWAVCC